MFDRVVNTPSEKGYISWNVGRNLAKKISPNLEMLFETTIMQKSMLWYVFWDFSLKLKIYRKDWFSLLKIGVFFSGLFIAHMYVRNSLFSPEVKKVKMQLFRLEVIQ